MRLTLSLIRAITVYSSCRHVAYCWNRLPSTPFSRSLNFLHPRGKSINLIRSVSSSCSSAGDFSERDLMSVLRVAQDAAKQAGDIMR